MFVIIQDTNTTANCRLHGDRDDSAPVYDDTLGALFLSVESQAKRFWQRFYAIFFAKFARTYYDDAIKECGIALTFLLSFRPVYSRNCWKLYKIGV